MALSKEQLAKHFEAHFGNRDDLPVPRELEEDYEKSSDDEDCQITIDESPPTEKEVKTAIGKFKNRRCMGIDGIWGEQVKYGVDSIKLMGMIMTLLTLLWTTLNVPALWCISHLTCLYKNKGSSREAKNYRAISILATMQRVFSQIFLDRACEAYNTMLSTTQCGFRTGVGTDDAIWGLSQCLKKGQNKFYLLFIDLTAAYDKIPRLHLFLCLARRLKCKLFLEIIKSIYTKTTAKIKGSKEEFPILAGVRQGALESYPSLMHFTHFTHFTHLRAFGNTSFQVREKFNFFIQN